MFDSCIGVSVCSLLNNNDIVYIDNPFDGVDVVTFGNYEKNSLAAAFLSGTICREFSYDTNMKKVRLWLARKCIDTNSKWEAAYLVEKTKYMPNHEAVIVSCYGISTEKTGIFIEQLYNCIIAGEYVCAIIAVKSKNIPSDFNFSLEVSPLTPAETLEFVIKSCRPSVVLHDILELEKSSDISTRSYADITPDCFWNKIREKFE